MTRTESIQAQKSTGQILIFLLFLDLPGTEVMQETEKQTAKEERSSCSERYRSEERGATNALLGFTQAFVRLFSWWVCAPTHNCCAVGTKLWQCSSEIVFPLSWAPCRLLRAMTLWSWARWCYIYPVFSASQACQQLRSLEQALPSSSAAELSVAMELCCSVAHLSIGKGSVFSCSLSNIFCGYKQSA